MESEEEMLNPFLFLHEKKIGELQRRTVVNQNLQAIENPARANSHMASQ
jgi:hypothetical protein